MKKIQSKSILKFAALVAMAGIYSSAFSQIKVYQTSGDSIRLRDMGDAQIIGNTVGAMLVLDANTTFQTIDGFGFAVTEGSAEAIRTLSAADQTKILTEIFDPVKGNGVSIARISLGASDLSSSCYSYDENDDASLSKFSLNGPDLDNLIPVLKQIKAINPNIKFLATPWSAPRWMKFNNDWVGGYLRNNLYDAYANYFMKYLAAMKAQGLNIWAISIQNEPTNNTNGPSMQMSSSDQKTFVNNYFGPKLRASEFKDVKIIVYDHNCDNTAYPIDVLSNSDYADGAGFHLYKGDISALSTVHNAVPSNKRLYFTEQSSPPTTDFVGDLIWHGINITVGSLNNWASGVLEWNLASYSNWDPNSHTGSACSNCQGALTIDQGKIIKRKLAYYTISHFSKFVKPNAKRIKISGGKSGLYAVAFINPDGSGALVTQTDGGSKVFYGAVKVDLGSGKAFTVWINGGALQTFSLPVGAFNKSVGVGIDNISNADAEKILVYPNPVNDQLTINSGDLKVESVRISDLLGRTVYSNNTSMTGNNSLNLPSLEKGTYFLNLSTKNSNVTKKLFVE